MSFFDPLAVVIDWLDSCRSGNIRDLMALYEEDASLECVCFGQQVFKGRAAVERYWQPKLVQFVSGAFSLIDITPKPDGAALDYTGYDGDLWRMHFQFGNSGLISSTKCEKLERS